MRADLLGRLGVMALFGCAGCGAVRYDREQPTDSSDGGNSGAAQATGGAGAEQASAGSMPLEPDASAGGPSQGGASFAGACERTPADAALTAKYRWHECGRIPAAASPVAALYTKDGSVLIVDDGGRVQLRPLGSSSLVPLVDLKRVRPSSYTYGDGGGVLSADGRTLLIWFDAGAYVYAYRASTDGPISAQSLALRLVSTLNTTSQGCGGQLQLSPDGAFALNEGPMGPCVWDIAQGTSRAIGPLAQVPPDSVGLSQGSAPLRVFEGGIIASYTLSNELAGSTPVEGLNATAIGVFWSAFSGDAESLVFELRTADTAELIAADASTGKLRWRHPLDPTRYGRFTLSNEFAVVPGDTTYRISDGSPSAVGVPDFASAVGDVGARQVLLLSEQVLEWAADEPSFVYVYGSHNTPIRALDLTRDGRYLASNAHTAAVWQIGADLSLSKALFNSGRRTSWDVTISPRGDAMITSGDNATYYTSDGSYQDIEPPPASLLLDCLSGTWAFSPDGTLAAGTAYAPVIELHQLPSFQATGALAASNCSGGVAFSADGSRLATASLELFDTSTGHPIWSYAEPQPQINNVGNSVDFGPDCSELVRTLCDGPSEEVCRSARYDAATGKPLGDLPQLQGNRVRYSPEGQWLVSNGRLLHVPTSTTIDYSDVASAAVFMPNGDLISGENDGSLVRYCRSAE